MILLPLIWERLCSWYKRKALGVWQPIKLWFQAPRYLIGRCSRLLCPCPSASQCITFTEPCSPYAHTRDYSEDYGQLVSSNQVFFILEKRQKVSVKPPVLLQNLLSTPNSWPLFLSCAIGCELIFFENSPRNSSINCQSFRYFYHSLLLFFHITLRQISHFCEKYNAPFKGYKLQYHKGLFLMLPRVSKGRRFLMFLERTKRFGSILSQE